MLKIDSPIALRSFVCIVQTQAEGENNCFRHWLDPYGLSALSVHTHQRLCFLRELLLHPVSGKFLKLERAAISADVYPTLLACQPLDRDVNVPPPYRSNDSTLSPYGMDLAARNSSDCRQAPSRSIGPFLFAQRGFLYLARTVLGLNLFSV